MKTYSRILLSYFWLVALASAQTLEQGLTFRIFDVREAMDMLYPLVPGQTPNLDEKRSTIFYSGAADFGGLTQQFIAECRANLVIPTTGLYGFRLSSDDGSELVIDEAIIIDHDGVHAETAKTSSINLTAGSHPMLVRFFQNQGNQALKLEWMLPGTSTYQTVPATAFQTEAGVTRVVAPGKKNIIRSGDGSRPGSGQPLAGVHPDWEVMTIRPSTFNPKVGAMAFHPDGRLFVTTFEPNQDHTPDPLPGGDGKVWALTQVSGNDASQITVTEVADGLSEPLGMRFIDGVLYVSERLSLTRLVDQNGDGYYETHQVVSSGWSSNNYHHFHFGIAEKDGYAYTTLSTSINFAYTGGNGPNPINRGTVIRTKLSDGSISYLAGGLRTPNGICFGPEGELFQTDNQGAWQPASRLNHIKQGHFYGHYNNTVDGGVPSRFSDQAPTPPAVYFPQNEAANSPSEPLLVPNGRFQGHLLVGEVTLGGINRVSLERVGGVWQGCVYRFTQGLEAGVNRLTWGPDGSLYVGCIGGTGNWSWNGTQTGLQRLRAKSGSPSAFEIREVRMTADGFQIEYTKPIPSSFLSTPTNFMVKQWGYAPTANYGGDKINEETLIPTEAVPSLDRKTVSLKIPNLKRNRVVYIKADPPSDDADQLLSTEVWYTINAIPRSLVIRDDFPYDASSLLAHEDFGNRSGQAASYPTLDGSTGKGWAAGWTSVSGTGQRSNNTEISRDRAFRPSLGDTGYVSLGERVGRNLDLSPTGPFSSYLDSSSNIGKDGTTLYLGVLIGASAPARHYYGLELHRDGTQDISRVLQIANESGVTGALARILDLRLNNQISGAEDFYAQTAGVGDYFVLRIDFGANDVDTAKVYLNPASHLPESQLTPIAQSTGTNLSFDRISFASFGPTPEAYVDFDDVRVASSWEALVGAPATSAYQLWTDQHQIHGSAAGFSVDSDGDDVQNGLEWLFDSNPTSPERPGPLTTERLSDGRMKLSFPLVGSLLEFTTLYLEYSSDLTNWTRVPFAGLETGDGVQSISFRIDESVDPWRVEAIVPEPMIQPRRIFTRLVAEMPEP